MNENEFSDWIVKWLKGQELLTREWSTITIEARRCLVYSLTYTPAGIVQEPLDKSGVPKRGGTGYEQDILLYETVDRTDGGTTLIPRVAIEVEYGGNTHHAIVHSEKARRIRRIYPYLRYGLILGVRPDKKTGRAMLPLRTFVNSRELDFVYAVRRAENGSPHPADLEDLPLLLDKELAASLLLGDLMYRGRRGKWRWLHQEFKIEGECLGKLRPQQRDAGIED